MKVLSGICQLAQSDEHAAIEARDYACRAMDNMDRVGRNGGFKSAFRADCRHIARISGVDSRRVEMALLNCQGDTYEDGCDALRRIGVEIFEEKGHESN